MAAGILKSYELREKIGSGGFAEVYRAYQPAIEREVAIKVIRPEYASQPEFIRTFESEARLVARLEHPHIVPLFDFWRDPDGAYLVMRWLRAGSLSQRLCQGMLPIDETLRIVEQIGSALELAHRHGVIHRDLKPDNILMDEDGNAYLTDFGIARTVGREPADDNITGTLAYIAPEQLQGADPAPHSDLYSFGIILYELLTGQHPFEGATPSQMLMHQLSDSLPDMRAIQPDLPGEVNEVIQKATDKDPLARYDSSRLLIAAFREALTLQSIDTFFAELDEATLTNPYKGLRAFEEGDAADFYGRETLVERLLYRLREPVPLANFLAVVGPSGSGKSSVVQAGLIPALRRGELSGSEDWFMATCVPGSQPLAALVAGLESVASQLPASMEEMLKSDPRGLKWALDTLLGSENHLLLVIDQFEEVFTLVDNDAARTQFLELLRVAVAETPRFHLVMTLRADFMDKPLQEPAFGELLRQRVEFILPMSPIELEQAITQPAMRVGLQVDNNLLAAIIAEVREEPGALPLLQYALTEVYEQREGRFLTLHGYQQSGGVTGALARRAEEVYQALPADRQPYARQMFLRLVTPGEGTEDTRRRVGLAELFALFPAGEAVVARAVLDAFGKYRLLTFDTDVTTRQPTVEVAHEALIRSWTRLRTWLDESREDLRMERFLQTASAEWEAVRRDESYLLQGTRLAQFEDWQTTTALAVTPQERDYLAASSAARDVRKALDEARKLREAELEERSRNRLRYLAVVLALAFIGALALSGFAFNERSRAETALVTATNALGAAEQRGTQVAEGAQTSDANALLAQQNAEQAAIAQGQALDNAATSDANAITATIAQGQAFNSAATSDANAERAIIAQSTADRSAIEANSQSLAANALRAFGEGDTDLGLIAAVEASKIDRPSIQAQRALYTAAYSPGPRLSLSLEFIGTTFAGETRTEGSADALAYTPDGTRLVYVIASNLVVIAADTGTEISRYILPQDYLYDVIVSSDSESAFTVSNDKVMRVRLSDGAILQEYDGIDAQVFAIGTMLSPDEKHLLMNAVTDSDTGQTAVFEWDVETGELTRILDTGIVVYGIGFGPTDNDLILMGYDTDEAQTQVLARIDYATLERRWMIPSVGSSLQMTPDRQAVMLLGDSARFWSAASGELLSEFRVPRTYTGSIVTRFTTDGSRLIVGSQTNGSMSIWDIVSGDLLLTFNAHLGKWIWDIAVHPGGQQIASIATDESLRIWNIQSGEKPGSFRTATGIFALDAGDTVTGFRLENDSTVTTFNAITGDVTGILPVPGDYLALEGINGNFRYVLFATTGSQIAVLDRETGEEIRRFNRRDNGVDGYQLSLDGERLAQFQLDENSSPLNPQNQQTKLTLEETRTGAMIGTGGITLGDALGVFSGQRITAMSLSPDGQHVLAGFLNGDIRVFSLPDWEFERAFLGGVNSQVTSLSFSPDGLTALTGSYDGQLVLWNVASGEVLHSFPRQGNIVEHVAFSHDGKTALSVTSWGSRFDVSLWRIFQPDELIPWLEGNRYLRDFTCDERRLYGVVPGCTLTGYFPTRTPAPPATPEPLLFADAALIPTATPLNLALVRTPTLTPPSVLSTPLPTLTGTAEPLLTEQVRYMAEHAPFASIVPELPGMSITEYSPLTIASLIESNVLPSTVPPEGDAIVIIYSDGVQQIILVQLPTPFDRVEEWVRGNPFGQLLEGIGDDTPAVTYRTIAGLETAILDVSFDEISIFQFAFIHNNLLFVVPAMAFPDEQWVDVVVAAVVSSPVISPAATATPETGMVAMHGTQQGHITSGGAQRWRYTGLAGEVLTIRVNAARPANSANSAVRLGDNLLDTQVYVWKPDGSLLASPATHPTAEDVNASVLTDSLITALTLPADGVYEIEVRGWSNLYEGDYSLTVTSSQVQSTSLATLTPTTTTTPLPPPTFTPGPTITPPAVLSDRMGMVWSASFNADARYILTNSDDNGVRLWDASNGNLLHGYPGYLPSAPRWSPDGTRFAARNVPGRVQIYAADTGQLITELAGFEGSVNGFAWSPDGQRFATAGSDRVARIWDANTGQELMHLVSHLDEVNLVSWSPDGTLLFTAGSDNNILLWDAITGAELALIYVENATGLIAPTISDVIWSPDGTRLLVTTYSTGPQIWDVATRSRLFQLESVDNILSDWSQDGQRVMSGSTSERTVTVWDAASGEPLFTTADLTGQFTFSRFSPDSRLMYTYNGATLTLWDVETGERVRDLTATGEISSGYWSPDSSRVLAALFDGTVMVWDVATGEPVLVIGR